MDVDAVRLLGPIPEGGIIAMSTTNDDPDPQLIGEMHAELARVSGHDRFLILLVPAGDAVGLFGPAELTEALTVVFAKARTCTATEAPCRPG